ncbi:uncharacterized protein [Onthophagus taurus]|uniref:uncharacterized protein n=1 Tax=Onthophagus taurus TaxID=166361 RepID=UPI000C205D16|nr:uncharacterized protein LOC111425291 [Onthophagus taurus]
MGFCQQRFFMLTICFLQIVSIAQRQVFDFLGYLWIPILINFFQIIFVIFGFYGTFQYRPKYIISYSVWHLFYLGWNMFLICLYLDIGILDHRQNIVIKLDPDSYTWWSQNGPGCQGTLNVTGSMPMYEDKNCIIDYRYIEIFQAGLQCFLAFFGIISGLCLSRTFLEEDDSSSRKQLRKPKNRTSLYSIEFNTQMDGRGGSESPDFPTDHVPSQVSPKPMTPRRVKRRSVMQRGSSGRHSTGSRRQNTARSSTRSSRRMAQNPVTRLLEQQQKIQHYDPPASSSPIETLPNYYSNVSNNNLLSLQSNWQSNGHTNPTYQQSSTQSLNEPEDFDELYNNRPASVRSSYSNFHGTRAINYNTQHYHGATPQVPQKRSSNPNRHSMRSMAFLNNGPPAYSSQGHSSPLDSETTI